MIVGAALVAGIVLALLGAKRAVRRDRLGKEARAIELGSEAWAPSTWRVRPWKGYMP